MADPIASEPRNRQRMGIQRGSDRRPRGRSSPGSDRRPRRRSSPGSDRPFTPAARFVQACAVAVFALFVAVLAGGCGSGDSAVEANTGASAESGEDSASEYRVILGNAISDTLRGSADFGTVVEPQTGNRRFVIRLATNFDFAGGMVFARGDTTLPAAGAYSLATATDTLAETQPEAFTMFYREGMLRNLRAVGGTLTLSSVSDTLITGTFDATLRGTAANLNVGTTTAEVHASGRFRADRNIRGYVIGL